MTRDEKKLLPFQFQLRDLLWLTFVLAVISAIVGYQIPRGQFTALGLADVLFFYGVGGWALRCLWKRGLS